MFNNVVSWIFEFKIIFVWTFTICRFFSSTNSCARSHLELSSPRSSLIRNIKLLISSVGSSNKPCLLTNCVSFVSIPEVLWMPLAISDEVSWNAVLTSFLVFRRNYRDVCTKRLIKLISHCVVEENTNNNQAYVWDPIFLTLKNVYVTHIPKD